MRRIGIVGLSLAAACALGALTSSSALAAGGPEYLACGKAAKSANKYTGKYTNKACSEVSATSEGKYERVAPKFPVKFSSKFGETKVFLWNPKEHEVQAEVPCAKGKDAGELTSAGGGTVTIAYEGCVIPESGKFPGPCTSAGQKPGVIVTEALTTELVWLDDEENEAGIALAPATTGGPFEEAVCGYAKLSVKQYGSLVGKLSPVGEATKLLTATFSANISMGEEAFEGYYEGGHFVEDKLVTDIEHEMPKVEYKNVPTLQDLVIPQKSGAILVS